MSRLQVGGLALIINSRCASNLGKVVLLKEYCGDIDIVKNAWLVSCSEPLENTKTKPLNYGHITSLWLMPLGDKKTQDELAKEKEIKMKTERELFLYELNGHGYTFENMTWLGGCFEDNFLNMAWEMWCASASREGYKLVKDDVHTRIAESDRLSRYG